MNRAVDDEETALAIETTVMCQQLNTLPRAGGLYDQDSYLIYLMQCVITVQNEKQERDFKKEMQQTKKATPPRLH